MQATFKETAPWLTPILPAARPLVLHRRRNRKPFAFVPDAERIELAAQVSKKAYMLGRALETMQNDAFDDKAEDSPSTFYAVTSRALGTRVRRLSEAAEHLLTDSGL